MPFHVRITRKNQKNRDILKLDLTEQQLLDRFIIPYRTGEPITTGGITTPIEDIESIHVNKTELTSSALLPLIHLRRIQSSGISVAISDEWYVTEEGIDVTDDYITGPPGKKISPEALFKTDARIVIPPQIKIPAPSSRVQETQLDPRTVWVVHGRNSKASSAMFSFLRAIDLHPIEWTEARKETGLPTPHTGDILEMGFAKAQAVLVLMTPDDKGILKEEFRKPDDLPHEKELTGQARLNVVFEAGMAMAYDKKRTVLVELGSCRPFSDIVGRHTLRLDNSVAKRQELAERLESAGCRVNIRGKNQWHIEGNFDCV
jgi:predicted nucleotide-binding protein